MGKAVIGSILLGSADPERLRAWYIAAFGPPETGYGFLGFGDVHVLVDGRNDVSGKNPEPGRYILNFHVDDARASAAHLSELGAEWLAELEERPDGWFGTVLDPDGNYVQIIELSDEYFARQQDD